MVHYFLTTTWCGRDDRFSDNGNKVSPAVHGCTSSNRENVSLFLALSFFLSFFYLHTRRRIYRRLLLGLSKSEFSASTTYPRPARAALLRLLRSLSLYLFLSRSVFLSLFHAVSSSFPSNVSAFRLLSSACLSDGGNERVRIEVSRRALLTGRGEKRTLSKCYPLGPSLPFSFLFFFLSFSHSTVSSLFLFFLPVSLCSSCRAEVNVQAHGVTEITHTLVANPLDCDSPRLYLASNCSFFFSDARWSTCWS